MPISRHTAISHSRSGTPSEAGPPGGCEINGTSKNAVSAVYPSGKLKNIKKPFSASIEALYSDETKMSESSAKS